MHKTAWSTNLPALHDRLEYIFLFGDVLGLFCSLYCSLFGFKERLLGCIHLEYVDLMSVDACRPGYTAREVT